MVTMSSSGGPLPPAGALTTPESSSGSFMGQSEWRGTPGGWFLGFHTLLAGSDRGGAEESLALLCRTGQGALS